MTCSLTLIINYFCVHTLSVYKSVRTYFSVSLVAWTCFELSWFMFSSTVGTLDGCTARQPASGIAHTHRPMEGLGTLTELECGPMPNVMAALPNVGAALCSTPQSLADAHY